MRLPILAAAVLAGASAGCMDTAAVLPPAREIFQLETWTAVPEGHDEVRAKVGDVLHLPLGSGADLPPLVYLRVEINGKAVDYPEFHTGLKTPAYVFRARQAGRYHVEVRRDFGRRDAASTPSPSSSDIPSKAEPRKGDPPSWPPRAWDVIISG